MLSMVLKYVEDNNMIQNGDKIIVGVSGGSDSICLLFLLNELKQFYELDIFAAHLNHGIRDKVCDMDEEFVKVLCEKIKVPIYSKKVNVRKLSKKLKISEEEAGRNCRYEFFEEIRIANNGNKIAVAHNMDDHAETVLINLFRGSGIRGLTGIASVRDNIIRPLLCLTKAQIENYLKSNKIEYREDETNFLEEYTRNKIRLKVLAYVENNINSKVKENIVRNANMLNEIDSYVSKNIIQGYDRVVTISSDKYNLNVNNLNYEDIVIRKGIVREVILRLIGKLKDIESTHIMQILSLMEKEVGKRINLPYGLIAIKDYRHIILYVGDLNNNKMDIISRGIKYLEDVVVPSSFYCPFIDKNISFTLSKYKKNLIIEKNVYTKLIDCDKISNTIQLRTRCEGDYIEIRGGKKKLKNFFIDEKIPREDRDKILLVADGHHIIWIVGYRISEAYKITDNTKLVLEIKIDGGNKDVG